MNMEMRQNSALDDCYPCIKGTMKITPVAQRTSLEARPEGMIHKKMDLMNV